MVQIPKMQMPQMPKISMPQNLPNIKAIIGDPWPFVLAWFTGAALAVFVPIIHWNKKKQEYYDYMGYQIEYENAQRAYEEAQHQDDNNNGNNYNYYMPNCSWWQYQCRKKAYALEQYYRQQQGDQDEDEIQMPNWYKFLGGTTEEQRRSARENGETTTTPGGLKLVYIWTLLLFVFLILYGSAVVIKRKDAKVVAFGFFLFLQLVTMLLVLVAQGVIETDERELEDSIYGWDGQVGVLLAYTAFGMIIYCVIAILALFLRMFLEHRQNKQQAAKEGLEVDNNSESNYKEYEEPKVTIS